MLTLDMTSLWLHGRAPSDGGRSGGRCSEGGGVGWLKTRPSRLRRPGRDSSDWRGLRRSQAGARLGISERLPAIGAANTANPWCHFCAHSRLHPLRASIPPDCPASSVETLGPAPVVGKSARRAARQTGYQHGQKGGSRHGDGRGVTKQGGAPTGARAAHGHGDAVRCAAPSTATGHPSPPLQREQEYAETRRRAPRNARHRQENDALMRFWFVLRSQSDPYV